MRPRCEGLGCSRSQSNSVGTRPAAIQAHISLHGGGEDGYIAALLEAARCSARERIMLEEVELTDRRRVHADAVGRVD
jgi:hypothetical protein